jgi:hypothetical protein
VTEFADISMRDTPKAVAAAILIGAVQLAVLTGLMRWAANQYRKWDDSVIVLGFAMQMAMLLLRSAKLRTAPKEVNRLRR